MSSVTVVRSLILASKMQDDENRATVRRPHSKLVPSSMLACHETSQDHRRSTIASASKSPQSKLEPMLTVMMLMPLPSPQFGHE